MPLDPKEEWVPFNMEPDEEYLQQERKRVHKIYRKARLIRSLSSLGNIQDIPSGSILLPGERPNRCLNDVLECYERCLVGKENEISPYRELNDWRRNSYLQDIQDRIQLFEERKRNKNLSNL